MNKILLFLGVILGLIVALTIIEPTLFPPNGENNTLPKGLRKRIQIGTKQDTGKEITKASSLQILDTSHKDDAISSNFKIPKDTVKIFKLWKPTEK